VIVWRTRCGSSSISEGGLVRLATRGSPLARWQAEHVAALLAAAHPGLRTELVEVDTAGDRDRETPLHELGGQGIFVKEVQTAVLDGRADVAVHSAKDLRSIATPGLDIVAVPARADARDGLVGSTLGGLPTGATVGTGSVRRRAQLAALRPDLQFAELRGNMHTRLDRAGELDAVVVAAAALDRLDLAHRLSERLDPGVVVPQVGQGALAVECRSDDAVVASLLAPVDDPTSHMALTAERAWLAELGSGCDLPVGAYATVDAGGTIRLAGLIATLDGRVVLRDHVAGDDPLRVGRELAEHQLARGGRRLLQPGAATTT
jgi:hydroxymethylbilane synthase